MKGLLLVLSLALALPAGAADYYVDPVRGDDDNPGTLERPWKTLAHASIAAATEGDVVHALPGVYVGDSIFPERGVRFEGAGPGRSVLEDGFVGLVRHGTGIEGFTLRDSSPTSTDEAISIWHQVFVNTGNPPDTRSVRRCRFERTYIRIAMSSYRDLDLRVLIEECEFYDVADEVRGGQAAILFIEDNRGDPATIRMTIRNNLVVGSGGLFAFQPTGSNFGLDLTLVNNTVVDSLGDAVFIIGLGFARGTVSNNLFAGGTGYGIRETSAGAAFSEIANNQFSGLALGDYLDTEAGELPTADELNTLAGASGNVDAAPLFVDAAAGDFRLAAGSPGIDAALDASAPAVDIAGDPRPLDGDGDLVARADVGADELNPGADLLRNTMVTDLDPLDPGRDLVFPLRSPRDDYVLLLPPGGLEDPDVLRDDTRPLVLYQLFRPTNDLFLVNTGEVRLEYGRALR